MIEIPIIKHDVSCNSTIGREKLFQKVVKHSPK